MSDITTPSLLTEFDVVELLNLLPDGAYITDRDRKIVFWNRAAERITGWRQAEVVNKSCSHNLLVHKDKDGRGLCDNECCPLHRSMVTNQPSANPVLVFTQVKSGARLPVEVSVAPLRNRAGEVVGGIEVFRDLAESMHDQLQAKRVQEIAMRCELPPDERVHLKARYLPRDLVGGDFYRIEKLGEQRYALLLVDVLGHGVSAGLRTMLLRSVWDDHRAELASPARFMQVVNKSVRAVMDEEGYFGTGVCVTYDAATGTLRCVLAGHSPQLVFRADGRVENLGKCSPILGLFDEVDFEESVLQLEPADTLLLFTDGATEIVDARDQNLGNDGLKLLVQTLIKGAHGADFDLEKLEEQLIRYSNHIRLPDDLTLIKLRRLC